MGRISQLAVGIANDHKSANALQPLSKYETEICSTSLYEAYVINCDLRIDSLNIVQLVDTVLIGNLLGCYVMMILKHSGFIN